MGRQPARARARTEEELGVLFPQQSVKLDSGELVIVRKWNVDLGMSLTPRVIALIQEIGTRGRTGDVDTDELVAIAGPECKTIVQATIGWTPEQMDRITFDDFLELLQAVIDTSLKPKGGGGAIPKLVRLVGALGSLAGLTPTSESSQLGTSSSAPDTPSPT